MTVALDLQPRPSVMRASEGAHHHSDEGPAEQAQGDHDVRTVSQAAFDGQAARIASPLVSNKPSCSP